jgi:hypothetical protein
MKEDTKVWPFYLCDVKNVGVNTVHKWLLHLSRMCRFEVPKEGIESCYGFCRVCIRIMVMNVVAPAESMAFTKQCVPRGLQGHLRKAPPYSKIQESASELMWKNW